MGLLRVKHM